MVFVSYYSETSLAKADSDMAGFIFENITVSDSNFDILLPISTCISNYFNNIIIKKSNFNSVIYNFFLNNEVWHKLF